MPCLIYFIFLSITLSSFGLLVRDGDTADNARFTGFPNSVSANTNYAYSEYDTTGVGWEVQNTNRQFALVSPQHFVCATHFRPDGNDQVRFLGSDGAVYTYEIQQVTIIQNSAGQNTDLSLGTLETVVDTRVITPFKWANFNNEGQYSGDGIVFGRTALTGNTSILGVVEPTIFNNISGNFANTRYLKTDYQENTFLGDENDAYLQSGDSGSPVFIIQNGELGLVGTNSLISNTTNQAGVFTGQSAFAAFIPEYITDLDLNMSEEGYQMSPLFPESTTLAAQLVEPGTLLQGHPATIELLLSNTGGNDAGNVSVTVQNSIPDTIGAINYFEGLLTTTSIEIHAAVLSSSTTDTLQLNWDALPSISELTVEVIITSDESETVTVTFIIPLEPSFLGFTAGLTDQSEGGDDDGDGISNLFEYAFGGDINEPSATTASGLSLLPNFTGAAETISFLRRTDAEERGLSYSIQCSTTLEASSWTPFIPDSEAVSDTSETAFESVSVIIPNVSNPIFYRLLVELDE